MRMYTDSADAIKAYAEEVNFDLSKVEVTEHSESEEYQRGGLTLAFKNYNNHDMTITIVHNFFDTFDITFWNQNKKSQTLNNMYFDELMEMFKALKIAMSGVTHQEYLDIMFEEE